MDILRVLTTPDLEVRKKTLQLALDLVSSRNVEEVGVLKSCRCFFGVFKPNCFVKNTFNYLQSCLYVVVGSCSWS